MSDVVLATIKVRGDTAAIWTAENPVLAERELGIETDTRKLKVGDGASGWTALEYVVAGGGKAEDIDFEPSGSIEATDVQAAIEEVDGLLGSVATGLSATTANVFEIFQSLGALQDRVTALEAPPA